MGAADPEEIEAWHEAGHAVVGHLLGGRVLRVSLEPEEEGFGGRSAISCQSAS